METENPFVQSSELILALLDQHAADERVCLEAVLVELCRHFQRNTIPITKLEKVVPRIVLPKEEANLLARREVLNIFKRWGICLDVVDDRNGDYVQISVTAVPTIFFRRLGNENAEEMTRLVRLYLDELGNHQGELESFIGQCDTGKDIDWGRVLRWMPAEILELVKSKSCRGGF
jgi:DNA mismatch repair protein MLH3